MSKCRHQGRLTSGSVIPLHEHPTKHVPLRTSKERKNRIVAVLYGLSQVDDVEIESAKIVDVDGNIRRNTEKETIAGTA